MNDFTTAQSPDFYMWVSHTRMSTAACEELFEFLDGGPYPEELTKPEVVFQETPSYYFGESDPTEMGVIGLDFSKAVNYLPLPMAELVWLLNLGHRIDDVEMHTRIAIALHEEGERRAGSNMVDFEAAQCYLEIIRAAAAFIEEHNYKITTVTYPAGDEDWTEPDREEFTAVEFGAVAYKLFVTRKTS